MIAKRGDESAGGGYNGRVPLTCRKGPMPPILDTIASYVPVWVTHQLRGLPVDAPSLHRTDAAVLLADISGFTRLAETLSQHPAGEEVLSTILNSYFGHLIALVEAHGGDVIKFAGDALIALWPADTGGEDLAILCRRAAQCALAIQASGWQSPLQAGDGLSLRVGIGAGEVMLARVGGLNQRWEMLFAGSAVEQLGAVLPRANPKDVVLSAQAWELIADESVVKPLSEDAYHLLALRRRLPPRPLVHAPLHAEDELKLQGFLPEAVLARVRAEQGGWLAELRKVTVLFINLPGFTRGTTLDHAQETAETLQAILDRYEGTINKLSLDEKGVSLVAVLGLPPLAHEDDALRGVSAALEIQESLAARGLTSAIGVSTGRAFCGEIGNARRREYTIIGDIVNTAARLMQAAPEDILCDAATFHEAKSRVAFGAPSTLTLKGRAAPLDVYRPVEKSRRHVSLNRKVLVGRDAEEQALRDRLEDLKAQGKGGLVVLEGEAGMGKSQLAAIAVQEAQALGLSAYMGLGESIEKGTPYHAWQPIFTQLFQLEAIQRGSAPLTQPLSRTDAWRKRVYTRLEHDAEAMRLAPLLNSVLPLDLPDNEITQQLSGELRISNTRDLLLRVLHLASSDAPMLLVLEDAHWLDSASWALVARTSQYLPNALIVLTFRPLDEAPPEETQRLLEASSTLRLRLDRLPSEAIRQIVCQRLGVTTLPEPVAELIIRKAEGHPFFGEQLAYALRDSGTLRITGGTGALAPDAPELDALDLPDTVQGIITSRIDRLSPSEQLTLKVASVIGRTFPLDLLMAVHPIEADRRALPESLRALEALDLVIATEGASQFKHALTQEVVYNLMLFSQRQQLHQAVAEWLERRYTVDLPPYYPALAHHWLRAEQPSKAVGYLALAGEQALESGAYEEAVRFLQDALAFSRRQTPDSTGRAPSREAIIRHASWSRKLAEAYYGLGRAEVCRRVLEETLLSLGVRVPSSRAALLGGLGMQVMRQVGHRVLPPKAKSSQDPAHAIVALAYGRLMQIHYLSNDPLAMIDASLRGLNLFERAAPSPDQARIYGNLSFSAGIARLHSVAERYRRLALDLATQQGNLPALAWTHFVTGTYDIGMGRWEAAREAHRQALAMSSQLGDVRRTSEIRFFSGLVECFHGHFDAVAEESAKMVLEAQRRNDSQLIGIARLVEAQCAIMRGNWDQSIDFLEDALAQPDFGTSLQLRPFALLALAHLRKGDVPQARILVERALGLMATIRPTIVSSFDGYAATAEVCLELWERDPQDAALATHARKACQGLHAFAAVFPIGKPRALLYQGRYDWLRGRKAAARRAWQRSLSLSETLTMPFEQALAHFEIGRHLDPADPNRLLLLNRAREAFERFGIWHYTELFL
ncbi:Adenylate cyclase 1 [compost metagenome]